MITINYESGLKVRMFLNQKYLVLMKPQFLTIFLCGKESTMFLKFGHQKGNI